MNAVENHYQGQLIRLDNPRQGVSVFVVSNRGGYVTFERISAAYYTKEN